MVFFGSRRFVSYLRSTLKSTNTALHFFVATSSASSASATFPTFAAVAFTILDLVNDVAFIAVEEIKPLLSGVVTILESDVALLGCLLAVAFASSSTSAPTLAGLYLTH